MLYNVIKNLINHNYYEREDMTNKLNVFMLVNQIAQDQYLELLAMINPVEKKEEVNDKVEEKPKDNIEITEDKKAEENTEVVSQ
ncbi:hypothetical protein FC839_03825 [Clostridium botulinum]|uniref:Uncharacterized protein n=2 Tax=Clostridium botulinum TaxID=1491 RepID=A0A6B4JJ06_CLOBO|nr:hypothetical protein [Clostridium botulinum]MBY6919431.1 hypothetical protein [Clostridium botulinum]NFJ56929.1 hypothetical protein [Clostridium botulinum]NFL51478.1 hypothetical protein [Clostridium botulinum]NFS13376.1 hypothetical protein [Clostridium botulinum]